MELIRKPCFILYFSILLNLNSIHMLTAVGVNHVSFNSPLNTKLPYSSKEFHRRLKGKGLEMMPLDEIASNTIGEPSCEELRAMWRYNKRQHRAAELSNQIPNLPNFWDLPADQPRSFGMFRSRGNNFRPKGFRNKQNKVFGRVLLSPSATRTPASQRKKPLEEVIELMGKPVKVSKIKEPVVHLMQPAEPTPESSFRKLKNMYREERMKDNKNIGKNQNMADQASPASSSSIINPTPPAAFANGREFGRLVLSPPKGQDGRIANKPKELMSPFERLRFGQVDDLLGIKDEIEGKHVLTNFPVKRRSGFVGFPMLRQRGTKTASNDVFPIPAQGNAGLYSPGFKPPHLGSTRNLPVVGVSTAAQTNMTTSMDEGVVEDTLYNPNLESELMNTNFGDLQVQNPMASDSQALLVEIPSCPEVDHQVCATNADCKCFGSGLYRCFQEQCQVLSVFTEDSDDYEINGNADGAGDDGEFWHSNPIPGSHLGMWDSGPVVDSILSVDDLKKRKRSN